MTRLIFFNSSIRWSCVGNRPAVSAITTSMPRARAAWIASKITAAGSPPFLRDHRHAVSLAPGGELLARRRAEGIARGEQHRQVLALQPLGELADRGRLAGAVDPGDHDYERLVPGGGERPLERREERRKLHPSAAFSACGVSIRSFLARERRRSMSVRAASSPASAEMSALSRSSKSCSSTRVPPKRPVSCEPVFFRPRFEPVEPGAGGRRVRLLAEVEHCGEGAKIARDSSKPPLMSRRFLLVSRCLLVSLVFAAGCAAANPYERTLANGLRVIVKEDQPRTDRRASRLVPGREHGRDERRHRHRARA